MNKDDSTWRKIQQQLSGPAVTPIARRRRQFVLQKRVLTIGVVVLVAIGIFGSALYLSLNSKTFAPYAQDQGRTKIVFFSDGQLTFGWFNDQFGDLRSKELLSIDITGLQSALLKNPQVFEATVERHFPRTLSVVVKERLPICRIKLKQNGKIQIYYMARDGQLFSSEFYKPSASLPWLFGLSLKSVNGQISPIAGAGTLADILEGFKDQFPDFYFQMTQIDMSEWQFPITPQTSVCLNTRSGTKFRFGPDNIHVQLQRLKSALAEMKSEGLDARGKLIDMDYPDKVAIIGGGKSK